MAHAGGEMKRLLIVDDHPPSLRVLAAAFRDEGYEVVEAASLVEALRHLETASFSLVLTDAVAELSGGLTDLLARAAPAPVALHTAHELAETDARRLGFAFCAVKPVSLANLIDRVEALLRSASKIGASSSLEVCLGDHAVHTLPKVHHLRDPAVADDRRE
jgi:DNA-binding response OmpR family regulator